MDMFFCVPLKNYVLNENELYSWNQCGEETSGSAFSCPWIYHIVTFDIVTAKVMVCTYWRRFGVILCKVKND